MALPSLVLAIILDHRILTNVLSTRLLYVLTLEAWLHALISLLRRILVIWILRIVV